MEQIKEEGRTWRENVGVERTWRLEKKWKMGEYGGPARNIWQGATNTTACLSNSPNTGQGRGNMRAKIKPEKVEGGYKMVAITPTGVEYPQEGRLHTSKASIYTDARIMYAGPTWDWRERDKTIKID